MDREGSVTEQPQLVVMVQDINKCPPVRDLMWGLEGGGETVCFHAALFFQQVESWDDAVLALLAH